MDTNSKDIKDRLNSIKLQIKQSHLILLTAATVILTIGGLFINIKANENSFDSELHSSSELITCIYSLIDDYPKEDFYNYMDSIVSKLPQVDVISIIDKDSRRIYHSNHSLIGTLYNGKIPDFDTLKAPYYTENDIGPSGPQRRTYSAIYTDGTYMGFIMTIRLHDSIVNATIHTVSLFVAVMILSICVELILSGMLFRNIKKEFYDFAQDFEGNRFLVDSMRANNHDFTNKLHVILGLIEIQEYDKAVSYIENISIIQKETVGKIMSCIESTSLSALLIGKIARACECNIKFIFKESSRYAENDIRFPSEALITITGNLIDNAIDALNSVQDPSLAKILTFEVYTQPQKLFITVEDTGPGITENNIQHIFDMGFSTKGEGRGTGLYHTKSLVSGLGGEISVDSKLNKGSTFRVSFDFSSKNRRNQK